MFLSMPLQGLVWFSYFIQQKNMFRVLPTHCHGSTLFSLEHVSWNFMAIFGYMQASHSFGSQTLTDEAVDCHLLHEDISEALQEFSTLGEIEWHWLINWKNWFYSVELDLVIQSIWWSRGWIPFCCQSGPRQHCNDATWRKCCNQIRRCHRLDKLKSFESVLVFLLVILNIAEWFLHFNIVSPGVGGALMISAASWMPLTSTMRPGRCHGICGRAVGRYLLMRPLAKPLVSAGCFEVTKSKQAVAESPQMARSYIASTPSLQGFATPTTPSTIVSKMVGL